MRIGHICLISVAAMTGAAQAQMSVSTFGATDARLCYEQAAEQAVASTDDCDAALRTAGMTKRDRIATLVNRGIILNRAGRYDEALADFGKALDSDAALAEAYLNRGNTYFLMRRFDEAIDNYRTSLDSGLGKAHVAWYNIGLAYEAKKDAVKAREAYRAALSIAPDFGPAQKKLAQDAPSAPN